MSRTTQFIGLNTRARHLVRDFEKLDSDSFTTGMFNEKIELGKWKAPADHALGGCIVREVVQYSAWSSGPVILTCLEADFGEERRKLCQWIDDPSVQGKEYDSDQGIFWL